MVFRLPGATLIFVHEIIRIMHAVVTDCWCLFSGHAKGLKSLNKDHLHFCDDKLRQIYNDPEVSHNTTKAMTYSATFVLTGKEHGHFKATFWRTGKPFSWQIHTHGKWWNFYKWKVYSRRLLKKLHVDIKWASFDIGTRALESEMAEYIQSLGKVPIAWEEALLNTGVVSNLISYIIFANY